ncbi:MAG TPA: TOBE domain-containing protein, partial [Anaerolineae bacterium]|nr:TOBE domain-containing protein [Anaerolineae bacterium]
DGVIEKMTYLGDKTDYRVRLGQTLELRIQTDGALRFRQGEQVRVHLPIERCRIIRES